VGNELSELHEQLSPDLVGVELVVEEHRANLTRGGQVVTIDRFPGVGNAWNGLKCEVK
jgi:hypothetical protein